MIFSRLVALLYLPLVSALHVLRSSDQAASRNQTTHHMLVVDHVPKCAGTFVNFMAKHSVNDTNLRLVHERFQLTTDDVGPGKFVVGMVRNPFDYYISLWAYQGYIEELSEEDFAAIRPLGHPPGNHSEDATRFQLFLERFSDRELGLLSFLMFFSYLDFDGLVPSSKWPWRGTVKKFLGNETTRLTRRQRVWAALDEFSGAKSPVNCWVKTEDASASTQTCFQEFAAQGGEVNFTAFQAALDSQYTNSNKHFSCSQVYTNESLSFVKTGDAEIFRIFGYPQRCVA
mmetsp:Transcript_45794/g.83952  ORF Transcript_45794/g.83952 Transcript_45794/m.83952 type:complete len:286 (+) Transcript_45794:116-973(+)